MKTIRFGVIGCGLMGREFGSACARWCHLTDMDARPAIVAICDPNPATHAWFLDHVGWRSEDGESWQVTRDYRELLSNAAVEAVYVAVPHHLHREILGAVIESGKHLMGEKPFGMDLAANRAIQEALAQHPEVFARCSSEFPFFPAVQRMGRMIENRVFGALIEAESGFLHSSDLDPEKPINWKRIIETNGEYGCLGDLGLHACHLPLRAGWRIRNVRAILSKLIRQRPDGQGGRAPCLTWDNATLLCEAQEPEAPGRFPLTIKTQRIAPGEKNTWYCEIKGTRACARFSTKDANALWALEYGNGGDQDWRRCEVGHAMTYRSITGEIFEAGFSDAVLQMWAAYIHELVHGQVTSRFAGCLRPDEAAEGHRLFAAALESHKRAAVVALEEPGCPLGRWGGTQSEAAPARA